MIALLLRALGAYLVLLALVALVSAVIALFGVSRR